MNKLQFYLVFIIIGFFATTCSAQNNSTLLQDKTNALCLELMGELRNHLMVPQYNTGRCAIAVMPFWMHQSSYSKSDHCKNKQCKDVTKLCERIRSQIQDYFISHPETFDVVPRGSDFKEGVKAIVKQASALFAESPNIRLGIALKAQYIVIGRIKVFDDVVEIEIKILRLGEIVYAASASQDISKSSIRNGLWRVVETICPESESSSLPKDIKHEKITLKFKSSDNEVMGAYVNNDFYDLTSGYDICYKNLLPTTEILVTAACPESEFGTAIKINREKIEEYFKRDNDFVLITLSCN